MNRPHRHTGLAQRAARCGLNGVVLGLLGAGALHAQTGAAAGVAAPAPRAPVEQFQVNGNTLLPADRIAATLARFRGERTLAELQAAASAVQGLYQEAGYGAVVVLVPAQTLSGGTVRIDVVEGKLATVSVLGSPQVGEGAVRAALPDLVLGQTPRVRRIDGQVQMNNENPARQVQVLLLPGRQPGEVEAQVMVTEAPPLSGALRLDNTGNPRTGRSRLALSAQHANLSGRDDVLSGELQISPEQIEDVAVLSVGYHLPLYRQLAAVDAYLALSDIDGGNTATVAGNLQFAGRGQVAGLRGSVYLPRWGELDQRATVSFEHRNYLNDCSIAGLPEGACGPAGESVSVQPLSVGYALRSGGSLPFNLGLSLHHNLLPRWGHGEDSDFEAVRPGAKPRYTVLRGYGGLVLAPPQDWQIPGWQLQARFGAQWTDDGLVSGEQFGIGGASSVRGYEERELAGDVGAAASVELLTPALGETLRLSQGSLRLLAFVDGGWIKNRLNTPCLAGRVECSMGSLGLGARWSGGPAEWRLDVAHALRSAAETARGDTHAHVSFSYAF